MKKIEKKVLAFPPPKDDEFGSTVYCQIGVERFAIHVQIEALPPERPCVLLQLPPAPAKRRKTSRGGDGDPTCPEPR